MRSYPGRLTAEVKDIIVSVAVLTAGFSLLIIRFMPSIFGGSPAIIVGASLLTVLTAFLLHELAHRYVAKMYGGIAFFKMWLPGVLLVLVTSLIGILFAAPGAVNIGGIFRKDQLGKTALAGPGTNLVIGAALYIVGGFTAIAHFSPIAYEIIHWMSAMNLWFALFNLIPLQPFDGEKVFKWDLHVYLIMVAVSLVMNVLSGVFI